jgi:hypothetical protein
MQPANRLLKGQLEELAPGLRGYTVEVDGALYIPMVMADEPGSGALSAYLDSLPHDKTIKFPTVISRILREALERRGYVERVERVKDGPLAGEIAQVWVRDAV